MNKQNTMQPLGETKSLQNIVIDEVCQKISDAVIDAEATSEEKYITKQKLIVSADDMNTQEQLDAMDRSYDRRNQERWQNVLYFAVVSFRFLYKGIIIKHNKTEPTYTKTSLFLCEKRRFFMARTEKGVVTTI